MGRVFFFFNISILTLLKCILIIYFWKLNNCFDSVVTVRNNFPWSHRSILGFDAKQILFRCEEKAKQKKNSERFQNTNEIHSSIVFKIEGG